jgi:hypothetical protein
MKKSTPYTFCEYCELVFSKLGQSIVNSEDFKICPECSYFNRVQYFPDAEFYYYGAEDNANFFGKKYYCDTCAQRDFKRQIVKNAPFLLAIPHTLRKKMQLESNIHPTLHEVTQANLLAQDGKLEEAEVLYLSLSLHNEFHPAVYYNRGKAYFECARELEDSSSDIDVQEEAKAIRQKGVFDLKKSLLGCANFEPTLELLRDNGENEILLPSDV